VTVTELLGLPLTESKKKFGERFAELVYRNGGKPQVYGWGVIELGGIYGSMGLEQAEALELIHLGGVIFGFLLNAPPGSNNELTQWIENEWKAKEGG
jgi:hypothetical protein